MPSRQFALKASDITMLVLCPNFLSDKTGFCLESTAVSAYVRQGPEAQSPDNTAGVWYSYTGINKQSLTHNSIEQTLRTAKASKE